MLFYRLFYPLQLVRITEEPNLISCKSEIKKIEIEVNAAEDEKKSGYCDWQIQILTKKKANIREDYEKWELPGLLSPDECLNKDFILRIEAKPKSHR